MVPFMHGPNLGRDSARLDIWTDATADGVSPNIQPSRISTEISMALEQRVMFTCRFVFADS